MLVPELSHTRCRRRRGGHRPLVENKGWEFMGGNCLLVAYTCTLMLKHVMIDCITVARIKESTELCP